MTHPRLGPLQTLCPQVSPGSVHLLRVVEDFIHLVGDALKAFQSSLIVTDNLGTRRQAREGVQYVVEPRPPLGRDGSEGSSYFSLSLALSFPHLTPYLYLSLCVSSLPPSLCLY